MKPLTDVTGRLGETSRNQVETRFSDGKCDDLTLKGTSTPLALKSQRKAGRILQERDTSE